MSLALVYTHMIKYLLPPYNPAAGGIYMEYSKGIRQEVFIKYACGYTPKEIAEETGIHFVTIYRWINTWKKDMDGHPLTDFSLQNVGAILTYTEELKRELKEAECSLSIIHTSGILQTILLRQRISMALPLLDSYPARFLAQTFKVSPSSIYYHKRQEQRKAERQKQDEYISSKIQEIFSESDGRLGAERIRTQLRNQGIVTSKKKIIKFMNQMGLVSNCRSDTYYPSESQEAEGANVQILQ